MAGAEVEAHDTAGVDLGVLLLLVRAAPASLSSPAGGGFQQKLRQAQDPVIALAA